MIKSDVDRLPVVSDRWFVGIRPLGRSTRKEKQKDAGIHGIFIVSLEDGIARGLNVTEGLPSIEDIRDTLFDAMRKPPKELGIKPCRPEVVAVEENSIAGDLQAEFAAAGASVQVVVEPAPGDFDEMIELLDKQFGKGMPDAPAMTAIDGTTPSMLSEFYSSAAEFYRAAPWEYIDEEQVLTIAAPAESTPWYAVVFGSEGTDVGLAAFSSREDLELQLDPVTGPQTLMPKGPMLMLVFGGKAFILPEDISAIKDHGYEIASNDGYPVLIFGDGKQGLRPPTGDHLKWFVAALRGVLASGGGRTGNVASDGVFSVRAFGHELKVKVTTEQKR